MAASRNSKSSELQLRILSGVGIIAGIRTGIYVGGWAWNIVTALLSLISLAEYYKMLGRNRGFRLSRGIGYICSLAVLLSSAEGVRPVSIVLTLSLSTYAIFMIEMMRRQDEGKSFAIQNVGGTMSGVLFIVVPWTCILLLRAFPTGTLILVMLFACKWSCDVMAYIVGKKWGRMLLCENISPGKTWEGFFGGAMGSILMSAVLIYFLEQPPYPLFIIGIICGTAGQFGDLAESIVKREMNVKDSGSLIPGHGGVLDRFDSILINGLLTYLMFGALM